jgi:UDP-N-acetylglucosamine--N-acetylmuramyl-(pentapeptide) pyrophosphoryl-undecaprenol N-acetylglucosamine transferase
VSAPLIFLCAGGTGGHLFPAEALAHALKPWNVRLALVTDERALAYAQNFPADALHGVASATFGSRAPQALLKTGFRLVKGFLQSLRLVRAEKPAVLIGFGGYPTLPPVLAGSLLGRPIVLHEQNGVMGRANRALASRATLIATGFPVVRGIEPAWRAKMVHVGNPVRPAVLAAAEKPYPTTSPGYEFSLLVFGGSQGARVMSDIVPVALAALPDAARARLRVVQQARPEDVARVTQLYEAAGIQAEIAPFFKDLPARMAQAHLVVARSGASTIAELGVIGRPALLVPLPHSLDGDQAANATQFAACGAAHLVPQDQFDGSQLREMIVQALDDPSDLTRAAQAAKSAGIPDAAARLAREIAVLIGLEDKRS